MNPTTAEPAAPLSKNPLRRLYHWVLHWADTPYGTPALALISFTESSFFPIPPDVLQIALSISKPKRAFYYALISTVASVLGALLGWYIGHTFWSAAGDFFYNYVPGFSRESFQHVSDLYHQNAMLAILGAAFTPIPFKIFTIAAGVCQVPIQTLVIASIIGRSGRFFLVAAALYWFGPKAKEVIEKYFEWLTLGAFALLVGGFVMLRYVLK